MHSGAPNIYGKNFIFGFTAQRNNYRNDYISVSILAPYDTNLIILGYQSDKPWNYTVHINQGEIFEYKLPISLRMDTSKHFLKGIEISSTRDILLYCLNNQHLTVRADGYLALPTRNLGLVYVVASYRPYDRYSKANIAVISAHDNNAVVIFLNKNVAVQSRGLLYDEGASLYITLEKLEALYISSSSDLSGTLVVSRKPVSVISGVDSAFPTGSTGQTAFFESFLLPVSLWANYYILTAVGTMNKKTGDIFRIFAYENETIVESASWIKVLSSEKHVELVLGQNLASYVRCNKPCQVIQYIKGDSINGKNAEPSMIVLQSVSQFLSYYRVVLPFGSDYHDSISIVIKDQYVEGLYMNGLELNGLRWKKVNGTEYVWTVVSLSDPNTVAVYHSSSAVKFGILVFGWNGGASYAYPGGLWLKNFVHGEFA